MAEMDWEQIADGMALWDEHKPQSGEDWLAVAERFVADDCTTEHSSPLFAGLALAVQQRDELLAALKPVAELADRLDAKGHLAPDPHFSCDEDLSFPNDVELSVADLKRARRAAERVRKGQ